MTINECVSEVVSSHRTLTKLWVCPDIVNGSKIGANYVYTSSIETRLNSQISDREVKKYWIEDNCLCIIYRAEGNPAIFAI